MKTDKEPIGLYIHIPFCHSKCPYCDFYSFRAESGIKEKYAAAVSAEVESLGRRFDSVYFGGGTPSVMGSALLADILRSVQITDNCEVTVECNPSDVFENWSNADFEALAQAGVNRVSLGLQSAVDSERRALGRRAGRAEVEAAIRRITAGGIHNISLDLMLGIPGQTLETALYSAEFCSFAGAKHISAYLLKIEEGTEFYKRRERLLLPDEDESAEIYLAVCEKLESLGFAQYEISNFAKEGFKSRHNLKYWHCEEYLGIGPAAHSFVDGRRFFRERSLDDYFNGAAPVLDGEGGSFEEFAMLALRLSEGLTERRTQERFGTDIPDEIRERAKKFAKAGLLKADSEGIRLNPKGFLVSNAIIGELLID